MNGLSASRRSAPRPRRSRSRIGWHASVSSSRPRASRSLGHPPRCPPSPTGTTSATDNAAVWFLLNDGGRGLRRRGRQNCSLLSATLFEAVCDEHNPLLAWASSWIVKLPEPAEAADVQVSMHGRGGAWITSSWSLFGGLSGTRTSLHQGYETVPRLMEGVGCHFPFYNDERQHQTWPPDPRRGVQVNQTGDLGTGRQMQMHSV